jgi:hypothetical protein
LDVIWTKILNSFPPCSSQSPPPTIPLPPSKSGLKLVFNIVNGNLKSENSQDYAQKPHEFGFAGGGGVCAELQSTWMGVMDCLTSYLGSGLPGSLNSYLGSGLPGSLDALAFLAAPALIPDLAFLEVSTLTLPLASLVVSASSYLDPGLLPGLWPSTLILALASLVALSLTLAPQ